MLMHISTNMLKDFHQVPEEMVREAAEKVGGTTNVWRELLHSADVFRNANTTPLIFVNTNQTIAFVSSEETFRKRLH